MMSSWVYCLKYNGSHVFSKWLFALPLWILTDSAAQKKNGKENKSNVKNALRSLFHETNVWKHANSSPKDLIEESSLLSHSS